MIERTGTWEERVRWYAEMEWPEHAMEALLAYCFAVDRAAKTVTLRALFDHAPSDQEKSDLWELEGGIGVHFPDEWQITTKFEMLPPAKEADLGNVEFIYRRGDAITPRDRWLQRKAGERA